jgi:putative chromate ion transporter
MNKKSSLKEVAKLFLKLGIIGPAVHISMMQEEVVVKRKWLSEQHFLDLIGASNLIPGPNSTEMAIHIGHERAGWKSLIVAGLCFILPAVLITGFLAWLYKEYGQLPELKPFLYGIKPAIIAIILSAVFAFKGDLSLAQKTFEYIFKTWLPNSKYNLDNRPHFEILGEKYKNNDPASEEEIWIPIKLNK